MADEHPLPHKWEGEPVNRYLVTDVSPRFAHLEGKTVVHVDDPDGDHGPGTRTWSFIDISSGDPTGWFTGKLVDKGTITDGKFEAVA